MILDFKKVVCCGNMRFFRRTVDGIVDSDVWSYCVERLLVSCEGVDIIRIIVKQIFCSSTQLSS